MKDALLKIIAWMGFLFSVVNMYDQAHNFIQIRYGFNPTHSIIVWILSAVGLWWWGEQYLPSSKQIAESDHTQDRPQAV